MDGEGDIETLLCSKDDTAVLKSLATENFL